MDEILMFRINYFYYEEKRIKEFTKSISNPDTHLLLVIAWLNTYLIIIDAYPVISYTLHCTFLLQFFNISYIILNTYEQMILFNKK